MRRCQRGFRRSYFVTERSHCSRTVRSAGAQVVRSCASGRDVGGFVEGAADRLAPILMTTLVTALGLLPLALGINEPGNEIEGAMALVILGGLFTSMALNLLVLPTLALRFGRFEPEP